MKITELQRELDHNYQKSKKQWNNNLLNLNMAGNFNISDAENFLKLTTLKSTRNWAVSQELTVNHDAMKKVIEST